MPLWRGVPLGRGCRRLRHAHDHVGVDRSLLRELLTHVDARLVDAAAVQLRVGASEVHELEQAQTRLGSFEGEGAHRSGAGRVDDHHLAGIELPDEMSADDVERRGLRREHPAAVETAEAQWPEPVGIAYADDVLGVGQHERERALETREHGRERPHERRLRVVVPRFRHWRRRRAQARARAAPR